MVMPYYQSFHT